MSTAMPLVTPGGVFGVTKIGFTAMRPTRSLPVGASSARAAGGTEEVTVAAQPKARKSGSSSVTRFMPGALLERNRAARRTFPREPAPRGNARTVASCRPRRRRSRQPDTCRGARPGTARHSRDAAARRGGGCGPSARRPPAESLRCGNGENIPAVGEDYRAAVGTDLEHDEVALAKKIAMPMLVL